MKKSKKVMFPLSEIPEKFLQECVSCAHFFADMQVSDIISVFNFYSFFLSKFYVAAFNSITLWLLSEKNL